MMRPTTLHIPQPCHESWAGMTPASTGRHCAACQKTVVDFTLKTDAEILAYLAKAAGGRTCGRFAAGQLERPLQRAAPAAPAARWRAWLAAAVAVWGTRETMSVSAKAQAPMEMRSLSEKLSAPEQLRTMRKPDYEGGSATAIVLRGIVSDRSTGEGLPGVTVLIKGTEIGTATNGDGSFELRVPETSEAKELVVIFRSIGYIAVERTVDASHNTPLLVAMGVEVMGQMGYSIVPPAPWHPRSFYYWGKYWLTRPFQRN